MNIDGIKKISLFSSNGQSKVKKLKQKVIIVASNLIPRGNNFSIDIYFTESAPTDRMATVRIGERTSPFGYIRTGTHPTHHRRMRAEIVATAQDIATGKL